MKQYIPIIAAPMPRLLPVVIPFAALLLLAAGSRIAAQVATAAPAEGDNAPVAVEAALARYAQVGSLSAAAGDGETLAALARLRNAPLTLGGESFRDVTLREYSPCSLLVGVSNALMCRAQIAAWRGDYATARAYVNALYNIGDRIAAAPTLTLAATMTVYHFHALATQLDARLLAAEPARRRLVSLRAFWKARVAPELMRLQKGRGDRDAERLAAARIGAEYRAEWASLGAVVVAP